MLPVVPELLPFPVTGYCVGVFVAVPPPILRVTRPPLPATVAANIPVFGIGCDLLPVVVGVALTLANGFAADRL